MRNSVLCLVLAAGCARDTLDRVEIVALELEPSALDLGNLQLGARVERTLTAYNTGNVPAVLNAALTPEAGNEITLVDPTALANVTLGVDSSLEFAVAFTPTVLGEQRASVTARYGEDGEAVASLRGAGVACEALLSCTPTPLDFGELAAGDSAPATTTCSNVGVDPMLVTGVAAQLPSDFAVLAAPAAGDSIAAGDSVSITVQYSPATAGEDRGTITLDAGGCVHTLSVVGQGIPPCSSVVSNTAQTKWSWTGSSIDPDYKAVLATPLVASLDGIGTHVVITTAYSGSGNTDEHWPGLLRVLNGSDGSEVFSVPRADHAVEAAATPAIGDLDGDGVPEIVAMRWDNHFVDPSLPSALLAFRADGTLLWESDEFLSPLYAGGPPAPCAVDTSTLAITDLEGNGLPEIIVGNMVFDHNGRLLWQGSLASGFHTCGLFSAAVDLDGDGIKEVVAGHTAYRADGVVLWNIAGVGDGSVAVADCDQDPEPEIFIMSEKSNSFTVANHDGSVIIGNQSTGFGGLVLSSTVAAGDLTGDGKAEWTLSVHYDIRALTCAGSILWTKTNVDYFSHGGPVVFDFNGDGANEVVFSDEQKTAIYRGSDGMVLMSVPHNAQSLFETPVVADLDRDGHADLLVPHSWAGAGAGLFVYTNDANDWAGAPAIWNQHTYRVTNVNSDGTVPAAESWPGFNVFRGSVPICAP